MAKPVIEKRTGDMTIFEAKNHASELSRSQKDKKVYVIVHTETGWCSVSYQPEVPDYETHHCYKNGSEIAMNWKPTTKEPKAARKSQSEKPEKLNSIQLKAKAKKTMKTSKNEKSAKKSAKKAAKKIVNGGAKKTMTVKEVIAALRKGKVVYNAKNGKRVNLKKVSKRANTSAKWDVVVVEKE